MTESNVLTEREFVGLYVIPGEGIVAAMQDVSGTNLYDKQGLEWLIVKKKKEGANCEAEEEALARIKLHNSANGG